METLIFILLAVACIILLWVLLPYLVAIPMGIARAVRLIVSGCDNNPEWVELKEARKRERAAKKEARRQRFRDWFGDIFPFI